MFKKLVTVQQFLLDFYLYDPVDIEEDMVQYYINLQNDKYLKYFSTNKYRMSIFEILGLQVKYINNDLAEVIGFCDDRERKLAIGDVVFQIDIYPISNFNFGKHKSSSVSVYALRGYMTENLSVKKEEYPLPNVSISSGDQVKKIITDEFGIIKFDNFYDCTIKEVIEFVNYLHRKNIGKICFDLRENKGGSIHNANKLINLLLPNNTIAYYLQGRDKNPLAVKTKNAGNFIGFTSIIIVVDSLTMSSAELLSIALRDNSNATVIGKQTYGKGIVSKNISLSEEGILFVPRYEIIAKSGESINKVGIAPTIEIDDDTLNNTYSEKNISKILLLLGTILPHR